MFKHAEINENVKKDVFTEVITGRSTEHRDNLSPWMSPQQAVSGPKSVLGIQLWTNIRLLVIKTPS